MDRRLSLKGIAVIGISALGGWGTPLRACADGRRYVAQDPDRYMGSIVGDGQCVVYVQEASGAPVTSSWREGEKVKGKGENRGTATATFQSRVYGNYTDGRSHAAIYIDQDAEGINVNDQWIGQPVHRRKIRFRNGATTPNNDGDAFSVIT